MFSIKSKILNYLTSSQKTQVTSYLAKFTQKHLDKTEDEILELFLEEEQYYLDIQSSRHPWIEDYIEDSAFQKDVKLYLKEQIKKYQLKELQKPYLEKQKEFQKQQRKNVKEFKMSKESPTKAQLSYYKSLCKRYSEDSIELENASKLDLRNAIQNIIQKHSDKEDVLTKLDDLKFLS